MSFKQISSNTNYDGLFIMGIPNNTMIRRRGELQWRNINTTELDLLP